MAATKYKVPSTNCRCEELEKCTATRTWYRTVIGRRIATQLHIAYDCDYSQQLHLRSIFNVRQTFSLTTPLKIALVG
jgi:hypothetical protein